MTARFRWAGLALILLAVGLSGWGWVGDPAPLDRAAARSAVRSAYEDAGLAAVVGEPTRGVHDLGDGRSVEVWKTTAELPAGNIELWIRVVDGQAVYLDDRSSDGTASLLADEDVEAIEADLEGLPWERHVRRNVPLTVGAALVALLGARFATMPAERSGQRRSRNQRAVGSSSRSPRPRPLRAEPEGSP